MTVKMRKIPKIVATLLRKSVGSLSGGYATCGPEPSELPGRYDKLINSSMLTLSGTGFEHARC